MCNPATPLLLPGTCQILHCLLALHIRRIDIKVSSFWSARHVRPKTLCFQSNTFSKLTWFTNHAAVHWVQMFYVVMECTSSSSKASLFFPQHLESFVSLFFREKSTVHCFFPLIISKHTNVVKIKYLAFIRIFS